jgi:hypothetical protein
MWLKPVIPATQEAEIREIILGDNPWQKVSETPPPPSQSINWVWWHIPVILVTCAYSGHNYQALGEK